MSERKCQIEPLHSQLATCASKTKTKTKTNKKTKKPYELFYYISIQERLLITMTNAHFKTG